MNGEILEVVYSFDGLQPADAWSQVWRWLSTSGACAGPLFYNDKELDGGTIARVLLKSKANHFRIDGAAYVIDFCQIRNYDCCLLQIQSHAQQAISSWREAVPLLISDTFISARLADREYEYWQNAEDPLQYEAAVRSYENLPLISNGLPYPLEKQVIDIRQNPGRRILRNGFVEAVGAAMWLGNLFFERVRCKPGHLTKVLGSKALTQLACGVVAVMGGEKCFTQPDGEEGRVQQFLRQAIYGVSHGEQTYQEA